MWRYGRDRIVVSTSRCGRDNPGSNPGHGRDAVDLWRGIATLIFSTFNVEFSFMQIHCKCRTKCGPINSSFFPYQQPIRCERTWGDRLRA